jgi:hypothetical protein
VPQPTSVSCTGHSDLSALSELELRDRAASYLARQTDAPQFNARGRTLAGIALVGEESRTDLERLQNLQLEYLKQARAIIAASEPVERVAVVQVQVFPLERGQGVATTASLLS